MRNKALQFLETTDFKYATSKLLTRIMICIILIATGYLLFIHLDDNLFEGVAYLYWTVALPVLLIFISVVELCHTSALFLNNKRIFLSLTPSGIQRNENIFVPLRHFAANVFIKWENVLDVKIEKSLPIGTKEIVITASVQAGGKTHKRKHRMKIICSEQSAEEILEAINMYWQKEKTEIL
jgi:hypothetical protein